MAIFGEARGQSIEAKHGVGAVIRNRAMSKLAWWKKGPGDTDWHKVILQPYQFSSFLPSDPNAHKMLDPLAYERRSVWVDCLVVADAVFQGLHIDVTQGSDHYFDDSIMPPHWAAPEKFIMKIDSLNFYRIYLKKPI